MKITYKIVMMLVIILISTILFACSGNMDFSINFEVDGEVYAEVSSKGNEIIKMPADPKKDSYIFDGWYWDKDIWEKPFTANSVLDAPLSENMTVYAKWISESEANEADYVIVFDTLGGTSITELTVKKGATITAPATPSKIGYTFDNWFTDNSTFKNKYIFDKMPAENITLYAKWIANEYNITFEQVGGSGGSKEAIATYDDPMPLNLIAPTKTGYSFLGYYDEINGGTQYYNDAMESTKNWDKVNDTTLYARWIEGFAVVFIKEGGDGGSDRVYVKQGSQMPIATAPTKIGHTFLGYYDARVDGLQYYNRDMNSTRVWDKESGALLYAIYSVNQYTLTFESNGGSSVDPITLDYKAQLTKPEPTIDDADLIFAGWFRDDQTFTQEFLFTTMPAESLTLYAKWRNINEVTYTVTFNTNGAGDIASVSVNEGAKITAPAQPTKSGYTFGGWYTDNNTFANEYNFNSVVTQEFTLYAKWVQNTPEGSYSVTVNGVTGSGFYKIG